MKTFKHNGKCGDVIFSLPTIEALGGGILYLPESTPDNCPHLFSNLKELLELQPYIKEVREYPSGLSYGEKAPGIHIDYDLDDARKQPGKGVVHIVKRYMDAFGVNKSRWKEPWLKVNGDSGMSGQYTLISYTRRHILNEQTGMQSRVDWKQVDQSIEGMKLFIGTAEEFEYYLAHIGDACHFITENAHELAFIVKGAKAIYCNQSLVLALAQSLGKEYYCDFKPGKTNCKLFTQNEHAL